MERRFLSIILIILILMLSASVTSLCGDFAAERVLSYEISQYQSGFIEDLTASGTDTIYYFTGDYDNHNWWFKKCHFYCLTDDGERHLFDYEREGDSFWINEFVATHNNLFWVCRDRENQYLEGYDLKNNTIFTVCEYSGLGNDVITYANDRYLTWFDGETPRSLHCLDTYDMKSAVVATDINNYSLFSKPFISSDNELIYRISDPAASGNALLCISDVIGRVKYKVSVPLNYPILSQEVSKNWVMYYNDSSVSRDSLTEIHCISRRTGSHKVFNSKDLSIKPFSCDLYGDYIFVNDNSSQDIGVISITKGTLYKNHVDGSLYLTKVCSDGKYIGLLFGEDVSIYVMTPVLN